jgi:hypothetical protein
LPLCSLFLSITSGVQIQLIMKHFLRSAGLLLIVLVICSSFIYGIFGKKEGIEGYVYRVSGNQMPSPDIKRAPPKGIKTTIYIYELTNTGQTTPGPEASTYKAINTRLVKKVNSNSKGYFKAKLPAGKYSLFTKEGDLFYANLFDEANNIAPVEVQAKKWSKIEIKMDKGAVY